VRLAAAVVEAPGLKEGDNVEIRVEDSRSWVVNKCPDNRELLARLRQFRGRLPQASASTGSKPMNGAEAFFDPKVLRYLLSGDASKANRAEALLASGGIISVQVLNEFAAGASRKLGMAGSEIREVPETIRSVCRVEPNSLRDR
jgi:antitoxin component of MazEF toxin-antitoxin module